MNRASSFCSGLLVSSVFLVVAFVHDVRDAHSQEIPTTIDLTTDITVGGRFRMFATFRNAEGEATRINRRDRCRIAFFANIREGDEEEIANGTDVGELAVPTRRVAFQRFRAGRPNGARYAVRRLRPYRVQTTEEGVGVIHAQVQLICGRGQNQVRILSNSSARFIICGRPLPSDPPRRFLRRVAQTGVLRQLRRQT